MAQAAVKDTTGYVNYVYNISARGTTEVASQLMGLSGMATNILGQLAFQTSSYLSTTEGALLSIGVVASAGFAKASQQAMEFDQALSTVGAISGKTRDEVTNLGEQAMAMSNKFGVAVNEMTTGLESLARAGVSTNNMNDILEEAMGLSKLEGLSLNTAINDLISTTNLLDTQGLDLSSPEYAEAVRYQNQKITATSEAAPINAQDIIHTLEHIGGYASSTNLDQDDLYAVIAQLGSKGTKSEMAGTSLRAFISAGQKDTAQRALDRIGLSVKDLWKNDETILSITDMKDVLDEAMEARGYTQQEKLEFYSDFAGYKQANQIMKIDTTSAREFKEKIDNSWDMSRKIGQVIGTAETHVRGLVQAGTNLLTKIGEPLLPIVSTIAVTLKTGIDIINAIPGSNLVIAGGLLLVSIKAISTIFNKIAPQIIIAKGNIGGIKGLFTDIRKDLSETYILIKNIGNTEFMKKKARDNAAYNIREEDKIKFWQDKTNRHLDGISDVWQLEYKYGFEEGDLEPYIKWKKEQAEKPLRRRKINKNKKRNQRHDQEVKPEPQKDEGRRPNIRHQIDALTKTVNNFVAASDASITVIGEIWNKMDDVAQGMNNLASAISNIKIDLNGENITINQESPTSSVDFDEKIFDNLKNHTFNVKVVDVPRIVPVHEVGEKRWGEQKEADNNVAGFVFGGKVEIYDQATDSKGRKVKGQGSFNNKTIVLTKKYANSSTKDHELGHVLFASSTNPANAHSKADNTKLTVDDVQVLRGSGLSAKGYPTLGKIINEFQADTYAIRLAQARGKEVSPERLKRVRAAGIVINNHNAMDLVHLDKVIDAVNATIAQNASVQEKFANPIYGGRNNRSRNSNYDLDENFEFENEIPNKKRRKALSRRVDDLVDNAVVLGTLSPDYKPYNLEFGGAFSNRHHVQHNAPENTIRYTQDNFMINQMPDALLPYEAFATQFLSPNRVKTDKDAKKALEEYEQLLFVTELFKATGKEIPNESNVYSRLESLKKMSNTRRYFDNEKKHFVTEKLNNTSAIRTDYIRDAVSVAAENIDRIDELLTKVSLNPLQGEFKPTSEKIEDEMYPYTIKNLEPGSNTNIGYTGDLLTTIKTATDELKLETPWRKMLKFAANYDPNKKHPFISKIENDTAKLRKKVGKSNFDKAVKQFAAFEEKNALNMPEDQFLEIIFDKSDSETLQELSIWFAQILKEYQESQNLTGYKTDYKGSKETKKAEIFSMINSAKRIIERYRSPLMLTNPSETMDIVSERYVGEALKESTLTKSVMQALNYEYGLGFDVKKGKVENLKPEFIEQLSETGDKAEALRLIDSVKQSSLYKTFDQLRTELGMSTTDFNKELYNAMNNSVKNNENLTYNGLFVAQKKKTKEITGVNKSNNTLFGYVYSLLDTYRDFDEDAAQDFVNTFIQGLLDSHNKTIDDVKTNIKDISLDFYNSWGGMSDQDFINTKRDRLVTYDGSLNLSGDYLADIVPNDTRAHNISNRIKYGHRDTYLDKEEEDKAIYAVRLAEAKDKLRKVAYGIARTKHELQAITEYEVARDTGFIDFQSSNQISSVFNQATLPEALWYQNRTLQGKNTHTSGSSTPYGTAKFGWLTVGQNIDMNGRIGYIKGTQRNPNFKNPHEQKYIKTSPDEIYRISLGADVKGGVPSNYGSFKSGRNVRDINVPYVMRSNYAPQGLFYEGLNYKDYSEATALQRDSGDFGYIKTPELTQKRKVTKSKSNTVEAQGMIATHDPEYDLSAAKPWLNKDFTLTSANIKKIVAKHLTPEMQNVIKRIYNSQAFTNLNDLEKELGPYYIQRIKEIQKRMNIMGTEDPTSINQFKTWVSGEELSELKELGLASDDTQVRHGKTPVSRVRDVEGVRQREFLIYDWGTMAETENEISERFVTEIIARSLTAYQKSAELKMKDPSSFYHKQKSLQTLSKDIMEDPTSILKINSGDAINLAGTNDLILFDIMKALESLQKMNPDEVKKQIRKGIDLDPNIISGLTNLGYNIIRDDNGNFESIDVVNKSDDLNVTYEALYSKLANIIEQATLIRQIINTYDENSLVGLQIEDETIEKIAKERIDFNDKEKNPIKKEKLKNEKAILKSNLMKNNQVIIDTRAIEVNDTPQIGAISVNPKDKKKIDSMINRGPADKLDYINNFDVLGLHSVKPHTINQLPNEWQQIPNKITYYNGNPTYLGKQILPDEIVKRNRSLDISPNAEPIHITTRMSEGVKELKSFQENAAVHDYRPKESKYQQLEDQAESIIYKMMKDNVLGYLRGLDVDKEVKKRVIRYLSQMDPLWDEISDALIIELANDESDLSKKPIYSSSDWNFVRDELALPLTGGGGGPNGGGKKPTKGRKLKGQEKDATMFVNSLKAIYGRSQAFKMNEEIWNKLEREMALDFNLNEHYRLSEEHINKLIGGSKGQSSATSSNQQSNTEQSSNTRRERIPIRDWMGNIVGYQNDENYEVNDDDYNEPIDDDEKNFRLKMSGIPAALNFYHKTHGKKMDPIYTPKSIDISDAQRNYRDISGGFDIKQFGYDSIKSYDTWYKSTHKWDMFKDNVSGHLSPYIDKAYKWSQQERDGYAKAIYGNRNDLHNGAELQNTTTNERLSAGIDKFGTHIENTTETLKGFSAFLQDASEVFPPLITAVLALDGVIGTLTTVQKISGGIDQFLNIGKMFEDGFSFEMFGQEISGATNLGKMIMTTSNIFGTALESLASILLPLLPIIAAITGGLIAIKGLLDWSYQSHEKYLKSLEEDQKEKRSKVKGLQSTNENAQDLSRNNRAPRQQATLDRNAQLAQTRVDNANMSRSYGAIEIARQKNDTLWGSYGISAGLSKLSGNYESTASEYDGTTGQIRRIKEATLANPFSSDAMNQVASYYDANQLAFGIMDEYKDELGKLYDSETSAMLKYHSDNVRESPEFQKALDDFVEATGITRDHAQQYLDYMQTEHEVDKATQTMQAQADQIAASTELKVQAIAFGGNPADVLGLNGIEAQQNAMIKGQADMIKMELSGQLWWKAVWATITTPIKLILSPLFIITDLLSAIWSFITGNWGDAFDKAGKAGSRLNVFGEAATYWGAWADVESTDFNSIGQNATDSYNRANYGNVEQPASGGYHPTHYLNSNVNQDRRESVGGGGYYRPPLGGSGYFDHRESQTHYINANRGSYHFLYQGKSQGNEPTAQLNPLSSIGSMLSTVISILTTGLLVGGGIYGLIKLIKSDFSLKDIGNEIFGTLKSGGSSVLDSIFKEGTILGKLKDKVSPIGDIFKDSFETRKEQVGGFGSNILKRIKAPFEAYKERPDLYEGTLIDKFMTNPWTTYAGEKIEQGKQAFGTLKDEYVAPWKEYLGNKYDERKNKAKGKVKDYLSNLKTQAELYNDNPTYLGEQIYDRDNASMPVKVLGKAMGVKDKIFGKAANTNFEKLLSDPKEFLSDPRNIETMAKDIYSNNKQRLNPLLSEAQLYNTYPTINGESTFDMENAKHSPLAIKATAKALKWKDKYLQGDSIQDVLKDPERTVDIIKGTYSDIQGGALDDISVEVKDKISGLFGKVKEGMQEGIEGSDEDEGLLSNAKSKLAGIFDSKKSKLAGWFEGGGEEEYDWYQNADAISFGDLSPKNKMKAIGDKAKDTIMGSRLFDWYREDPDEEYDWYQNADAIEFGDLSGKNQLRAILDSKGEALKENGLSSLNTDFGIGEHIQGKINKKTDSVKNKLSETVKSGVSNIKGKLHKEYKYCPECGYKNEPDAEFCENCGFMLNEETIEKGKENALNMRKTQGSLLTQMHMSENIPQNAAQPNAKSNALNTRKTQGSMLTNLHTQEGLEQSGTLKNIYGFCEECGGIISEEDEFCPTCGARVKDAEAYCPVCNAGVSLDDEYCMHCGAELKPKLKGQKVKGALSNLLHKVEDKINGPDSDVIKTNSAQHKVNKAIIGIQNKIAGVDTETSADKSENSIKNRHKRGEWSEGMLGHNTVGNGPLSKTFKMTTMPEDTDEPPMSRISKFLEKSKYPKYYDPNLIYKEETPGAMGEMASVLDFGEGENILSSDNLSKGGKGLSKIGKSLSGKGGKLGKVGNIASKLGGGMSKAGSKGLGSVAKGGMGKLAKGGLGKVGGKIAGKIGGKLAAKGIAQVGSKVLGGALIASGIGAPLGLLLESPIGGALIEGAMNLGGKALGAIGGAVGGVGKAIGGLLGFGKKTHYQQAGAGKRFGMPGLGMGGIGMAGMAAGGIAGLMGMGVGLLGSIFKNNKDQKNHTSNIGDLAKNILKNIIDGNKKQSNNNNSGGSITIQNININTADDPEAIKAMFLELLIELQEQVNPRLVSRTVGTKPSNSTTSTTDTLTDTSTDTSTDTTGQSSNNTNGTNT